MGHSNDDVKRYLWELFFSYIIRKGYALWAPPVYNLERLFYNQVIKQAAARFYVVYGTSNHVGSIYGTGGDGVNLVFTLGTPAQVLFTYLTPPNIEKFSQGKKKGSVLLFYLFLFLKKVLIMFPIFPNSRG